MHKRFSGTGILIILLLTGAACRPKAPDKPEMKVATLKGPSAMSMAPMIRKSLPDTISTYHIYDEPLQVRALMLKGEADIVVLPSTFGALMYNLGIPYRLIAVPVWGNLYLLGPEGESWDWDLCRGKRIYLMARGMTPDILFRYLASAQGLNPDADLILDYSFPSHIDLAQAMAAGHARYGVVSEPMASMVLQKNPGLCRLLDLNQNWKEVRNDSLSIPQTAVMVREKFAAEHPDLLEEFLDEYAASIAWINAHPTEAGQLIDSLGIVSGAEIASRSIPWSNIRFSPAAEVSSILFDYCRVFYNFNPETLGGKMPDETFIYTK